MFVGSGAVPRKSHSQQQQHGGRQVKETEYRSTMVNARELDARSPWVAVCQHPDAAALMTVRLSDVEGYADGVHGRIGPRAMSSRLIGRWSGRRRPPVGCAGIVALTQWSRGARARESGVDGWVVPRSRLPNPLSHYASDPARALPARPFLVSPVLGLSCSGPVLFRVCRVSCGASRGVRWSGSVGIGGSTVRLDGRVWSGPPRTRLAVELQIDNCRLSSIAPIGVRRPAGAGLSRCRAGTRRAGRHPGGGCRQRPVR